MSRAGSFGQGDLFFLDPAKNAAMTSFEVGQRPWGVGAAARTGRRSCTANGPSNDVSFIDLATKTVKKVSAGTRPWGIAIVGR